MGVRRSGILSRVSRRLDNSYGFVCGFALPPFAVVAALVALSRAHEHAHAYGSTLVQCLNSAEHLREVAQADGRFPAPGEGIERLIESKRQGEAWACIGALRYERLDEHGTRARIVALGADGAPGGEGCDGDVVVWFDRERVVVTHDARELPEVWR